MAPKRISADEFLEQGIEAFRDAPLLRCDGCGEAIRDVCVTGLRLLGDAIGEYHACQRCDELVRAGCHERFIPSTPEIERLILRNTPHGEA